MQGVLSARAKITSGFSEPFRRGIVTLPKIRNSKLEIRNKPEGPKSESQNQASSRRFEPWSFRILNLFRVSDFGLRICRALKWRVARCWNSARKSDFVFAQTLSTRLFLPRFSWLPGNPDAAKLSLGRIGHFLA